MQIAGNKCTICGRKIVFAAEGRFCVKCSIVVHLACDGQATCPVCGGPLRENERPTADPEWVRFGSRDRNFGPAVAVLFVLFGLIIVIAIWLWEIVRPQGC